MSICPFYNISSWEPLPTFHPKRVFLASKVSEVATSMVCSGSTSQRIFFFSGDTWALGECWPMRLAKWFYKLRWRSFSRKQIQVPRDHIAPFQRILRFFLTLADDCFGAVAATSLQGLVCFITWRLRLCWWGGFSGLQYHQVIQIFDDRQTRLFVSTFFRFTGFLFLEIGRQKGKKQRGPTFIFLLIPSATYQPLEGLPASPSIFCQFPSDGFYEKFDT